MTLSEPIITAKSAPTQKEKLQALVQNSKPKSAPNRGRKRKLILSDSSDNDPTYTEPEKRPRSSKPPEYKQQTAEIKKIPSLKQFVSLNRESITKDHQLHYLTDLIRLERKSNAAELELMNTRLDMMEKRYEKLVVTVGQFQEILSRTEFVLER